MADIFDTVSDPNRRAILELLRDRLDHGERLVAVDQIVEGLGASRQSVNRQLGILKDAGLVAVADDGPHREYRLVTTPLEQIEDWLAPFSGVGHDEEASAGETVFSAWSGTDVGDTIGRTLAERAHRARSAVDQARVAVDQTRDRVVELLPETVQRRVKKKS